MEEHAWPPVKGDMARRRCSEARECLDACRNAEGKPVIIYLDDPQLLLSLGDSLPNECVIIVKPKHARLEGRR